MSNKLRRWLKDVAWEPIKTTVNTLTALGWIRLWSGLHHQLNINTIPKDSYVSQKGSIASHIVLMQRTSGINHIAYYHILGL